MPIADHGGFDLATEVAEDTITFAVRTMGIPAGAPMPFNAAGFAGQILPQVAVEDTDLVMPDVFRLELATQGTIARVTQITLGGAAWNVPAWMQNVPIGGIVTVDDALEVRGTAVVVDYTSDRTRNFPSVNPALDEAAILAAPLVQFILAQAILADPRNGTAYNAARAQLLTTIRNQVGNAVRAQMGNIGTLTVAPPPAIPGVVIASMAFRMGDRAIHLLYSICGLAGSPASITRSNLLRRTSDQQPLDVGTLIISNAGLLGCFVRPSVIAGLGLTPGGFIAGHPCFWTGSAPIRLPGGNPPLISGISVTSVLAGVDGTNLRLLATVVATGTAGAFTVTASIDTTFSLNATATGRTLTLAMTPLGAPVVSSDVTIAWWVYVGGFIAGGIGLAAVLAAIDLFSGELLNGLIGGMIAPFLPAVTITVPLPAGVPSVSVRAQSLRQADAPIRTLRLPNGSLFSDPFPANDRIVNLV